MQRNIFIDNDNDIFIKKGQRKLTQIKKHSLESFNSFREREIRSEMILMKMHSHYTKPGFSDELERKQDVLKKFRETSHCFVFLAGK